LKLLEQDTSYKVLPEGFTVVIMNGNCLSLGEVDLQCGGDDNESLTPELLSNLVTAVYGFADEVAKALDIKKPGYWSLNRFIITDIHVGARISPSDKVIVCAEYYGYTPDEDRDILQRVSMEAVILVLVDGAHGFTNKLQKCLAGDVTEENM